MSMFHHEMDGGKSKQIHWSRYDEANQTLQVDFRNSKGEKSSTYEYAGFTPEDWARFQAADSKGKHFAFSIRGKFTHRKLS